MSKRKRVQIVFPGDGRTKQSFVAESNVNNLMQKYQKVDMHALSLYRDPSATFQDVSAVEDYQNACNIVIQANEMFAAMPSSLRARFSNDPASFLAFAHDPKNKDEMRSLGLLKEEVVTSPNIVPLGTVDEHPPL